MIVQRGSGGLIGWATPLDLAPWRPLRETLLHQAGLPLINFAGRGYTGSRMETQQNFSGWNVNIEEWEGPLDLLLMLIKKNEANIYDIPIAKITEQYLAYLACAPALSLDEITDFHDMAATLLLIKSRTLIPTELEVEDEEDPRQELVERLIEYQRFKKLSELMEEKEREAEWMIERKKLQRALPFADDGLWQEVDVWDLCGVFTGLMKNLTSERILDLYEEVSVNEKIALLMELLEKRGECAFTDLVVRNGSIMDIVCAFLAILEAVKFKMVRILQNRMFGDILIRPREDYDISGGVTVGERNSAD